MLDYQASALSTFPAMPLLIKDSRKAPKAALQPITPSAARTWPGVPLPPTPCPIPRADYPGSQWVAPSSRKGVGESRGVGKEWGTKGR